MATLHTAAADGRPGLAHARAGGAIAVLIVALLATACSGAAPPPPDVVAAHSAPTGAAPTAGASNPALATTGPDLQPCVERDSDQASTSGVDAAPTADTMYREPSPASGKYVADAPWFINGEAITVGGTRYVKSARSKVFGASSVKRFGQYEQHGVPIYMDAGMAGTRHMPPVVYVPVRPGCEFHLYDRVYTANDT
ncbi:MAG TPA: hypothetical protein VGB92_01010 [Longimicrobium sp.]|jgi:hypothetical protein